jgi:hypothetical protein
MKMKAFSKLKAKKFHDTDLILLAIDYFEYILHLIQWSLTI